MIPPVLPTYARTDVMFERGEGAYLYTADGRRYLDFCAGVAVVSLGHAHPRLVEAVTEQAKKLWHTSNLYRIEGQERLARRFVENSFADTVFFCNSGAEAVECAIKMARKYHAASGHPERYRIITFQGSFHGRTLATLAAAGNAKYLDGFGPEAPGFDHLPFAEHTGIEAAITPETAAIMIEPVMGEGGVQVVPSACLKGLREICDRHGLLLVLDEVQTGMGRTGRLFAHEWAGIKPDIMALAKGIAGGFPMGACLATERAATGMTAGSHGSTFGGNPLAMAAGNAVLDVMLADGFFDNVRRTAGYLRQRVASVTDKYGKVFDGVRGEGLLIGLKCKLPNTELVGALFERGLLTAPAGDNVVRFVPPLTIGVSEVDEAVGVLEAASEELSG